MCKSKGVLLGGGPGIALSKGALISIRAANCIDKNFKVISQMIPGGDGWLGQCLTYAKVPMVHDWRFKPLPPLAFDKHQQAHAVSFHKSHVREAHEWLSDGGWKLGNDLCNPVLLRDLGKIQCLPLFTIIGAQKSGTTSMFQ
jgi:hypothetical protein